MILLFDSLLLVENQSERVSVNVSGRKLLRIYYRYKDECDFSLLFARQTRRYASNEPKATPWIPMRRQQWLPDSGAGDELSYSLHKMLLASHPDATDIQIDKILVLRQDFEFLRW